MTIVFQVQLHGSWAAALALSCSVLLGCGPSEIAAGTGATSESVFGAAPAAGSRAEQIRHAQTHASAAYSVSNDGGFRASNPAQQLAAELDEHGVRLSPLADGSWSLGWSVARYGCQIDVDGLALDTTHVGRAAVSQVSGHDNAVALRHAGAAAGPFTEWYVNGPLGLEQGFTLPDSPRCAATSDEAETIAIAMSLSGGLTARLAADGASIRLWHAPTARALRIAELYAYDADGRPLAARFALRGDTLSLHVDAAGAAYPVVVDPLVFVEQQELRADDATEYDLLGSSASLDGDVAVVGATGADSFRGAAYVFVRSGFTWSQQQRLIASDGAADDYFGVSVALSQSTAIVGTEPVTSVGPGFAYVFSRNATAWSEQQRLVADDGVIGDGFGFAVAVDGNTTLIGAPSDPSAAYVFVRNGATWSQQQKLTASDAALSTYFGAAVALSGDTAVVGARGADTDRGAAYVFVRSGTTWTQQQKLTASDAVVDSRLGSSVSVDGDTVVIGATGNGGQPAGAAYVFVRNGGVWAEQQKLIASDGADGFGFSVGISGDMAAVAALADAGAGYTFMRSGAVWTEFQKLTASDGANNEQLLSLAASGNTVLLGSEQHAHGIDGSGAVYVYALLDTQNTGQPCGVDDQCDSGFCVDGVCCDMACDGLCEACSADKKGAGDDGVCEPIGSGLDPDDECPAEAACQDDPTCDGARQCACISGDTTICGPDGHTLEGPGGVEDCAPFRCTEVGNCLSACASTSDCIGGYVCDADAQCVLPAAADSDEGCSCNAPGQTGGEGGGLAALVVMIAAAVRRRRRVGSKPSGG